METIIRSIADDGEDCELFKLSAEIDTALYCNGSTGIGQVYIKPSTGMSEVCLFLEDDDGESELGFFPYSAIGIEDCLLLIYQNQNSLSATEFLSELGFELEDNYSA